ncbi:unnamed protein product [Calypogeia fissa]
MATTGIQIQVGSRPSASLPSLWSGSGSGSVGDGVSKTHLHLPLCRADFSLRRRSVRLQHSNGVLQFSIFHGKLSKCRVYVGANASPTCRLEELSTAEELGGKNSSRLFNEEAIRAGSSEDTLSSLATGADREGSLFNWLKQWYPVGVLKHMDKSQPHPVTVLGRDIVMWWDRNGAQWQIFADVCPHRLAPLSEGRIDENGQLQCTYHGWTFAPSTGACTRIPQATPEIFEKKNPKRSCTVVYPSKEQQGMLWVYMDTSVGAEELAENPPPFLPVLSDPDFVYDLGMSDVPYSYESLIENLLDPAHVPFAHHKLQGRRESAKPLNFRVEKVEITGFRGSTGDNQPIYFVAPCMSKMDYILPPPRPPKGHPWALKLRELIMSKGSGSENVKRQLSIIFIGVPLTPDKSRVFFVFPRNFAKSPYKWTPKWWNHLVHMTVLDSDNVLLHLMERRLQERGGMAKVEKLFYCPTASDAFVIAYRKWLKTFGGGVPDHGPKATDRLQPTAPLSVIFDRHTLHVENCTYCSGAKKNLLKLVSVLQALPLVLIGLVAASNSRPLRGIIAFSIPLVCTAFLSLLASRWLQQWIKKNFEYHGYNHSLVK